MELMKIETMTLKEITDLLEVRHNNAMLVVEKMLQDQEFGTATKIQYQYTKGNNARGTIETYQLNKRQSIAVAAKLNTSLLMRIIDRWQELEDANKEPLTLAEITLIHAQRLVNIEREQKRLAQQQAQVAAEHTVIKAQLSALTQGENFMTIVGYANLKNQKVDSPTAARLGKLASKYCRENNIMTGNANHPVYGTCKTYPVEVLESVLPF